MTKTAITAAELGTSPAIITHTYIRLRGQQSSDITVHHARTRDAKLTFNCGGVHMTVLNAEAAQGILEALSAARAALINLPTDIGPQPATDEAPYARPAIAIEWTRRPSYAVVPRSTDGTNINTRVVHWVELCIGPITLQILDRTAYRSAFNLLRKVHETAVAVFLDGEQHTADPTEDDYRVAETATGLISRPH